MCVVQNDGLDHRRNFNRILKHPTNFLDSFSTILIRFSTGVEILLLIQFCLVNIEDAELLCFVRRDTGLHCRLAVRTSRRGAPHIGSAGRCSCSDYQLGCLDSRLTIEKLKLAGYDRGSSCRVVPKMEALAEATWGQQEVEGATVCLTCSPQCSFGLGQI